VATWLARARERLRGRLTRRGLALSAGTFAAVLSGSRASAAVPRALAGATARAAVLGATGALPAVGLVSPHVAPLVKGVLRAMLLTQLKLVAGSLVGAALLLLTAGAWVRTALAEEPPAPRPATPLPPVSPSVSRAPRSEEMSKAYHIHLYIHERDTETGATILLSRPQVMTLEGQTASITVGGGEPSRHGKISGQIAAAAGAGGTIRLQLTFEHARATSEEENAETGADVAIRRVETVRSVPLRVPVRLRLVSQREPDRHLELVAMVVSAPQEATSAKQAEKDLKVAEFYERTNRPQAAYFSYDLVRRRYPGTASAEQAHAAMLRLQPLQPQGQGRVGQIIIIGNVRTSDAAILKQVPFVPGQALDLQALKTAEQNLVRLGVFQVDAKRGIRPTVTVLDQADDGFKDILITVQEK
jgi:hypothetical protein